MVGPNTEPHVVEEIPEDECVSFSPLDTFPENGDTNDLTLRMYRHWKDSMWLLADGKRDSNER